MSIYFYEHISRSIVLEMISKSGQLNETIVRASYQCYLKTDNVSQKECSVLMPVQFIFAFGPTITNFKLILI